MQYVQLKSFDNYLQANIQLSMLQDAGISCHLKDEYTITIDPFLSPLLGGMKLMVMDSQAERALSLLEEVDKDYLSTLLCPNCKHHALQQVIVVHNPAGFWKKLLFTLAFGQSKTEKTIYHCSFCNKEFDELYMQN